MARTRLARQQGAGLAFVSPYFLVFAVFGLFPLVYTAWVSMHEWTLLAGKVEFIGLENYRELMVDSSFWRALVNTFGIFVLATVPQLVLATVLAQMLNTRLRSRTFWRMGVLLPNVASVAAVGIIFGMIFARDYGIANWLLGQIGIDAIDWRAHRWSSWLAIATMVDWRWTGYNALILLAALQSVPKELYEAAKIDGASAWRQFWSITVPMLRPTLIFVTIVATIGGIQLFTEPLLFNPGANAISGGNRGQFQTVAMYLVQEAFTGQRFGYASTIAWVLFLIIALVAAINLLLLRRIRSAD
ncbi:ABC transporter permease subunit [Aeromicrobium sp. 636]|uniref:Sugar ABC transporter permease n=1 Tax=Aeromicrobium senzhongii TaxID=2663859 RepID=A0A8I0ERQ4_9ACTN|nr:MULTISPECIES: sugar ABC transporter permease [Aeromicrobium]MBC9224774.1 sugar ABC transporter permease [Aeromicrobium senzhongii]MCQ3996887.1 ABC transporter permease subunit [Aeromicrobium sp. 636]MTB86820.1 ABC transporter permease subunit [Aeromicrobium senzhongii]QNL93341.1 sugar ABC transporter permease [Aeromicrobium senzhongii]